MMYRASYLSGVLLAAFLLMIAATVLVGCGGRGVVAWRPDASLRVGSDGLRATQSIDGVDSSGRLLISLQARQRLYLAGDSLACLESSIVIGKDSLAPVINIPPICVDIREMLGDLLRKRIDSSQSYPSPGPR